MKNENDIYECPICNNEEYWDCGHLVASLDLSYGECRGGIFFDHVNHFLSLIENSFLDHLKNGKHPQYSSKPLSDLWKFARDGYSGEQSGDLELDIDLLQKFFISLLVANGAKDVVGEQLSLGGLGAESMVVLLFSDHPPMVVERALHQLKAYLKIIQ